MQIITVKKNDAGQRLDKFLAKAVKGLPTSLMYKYIPNTLDTKGEKQEHNFQITGVWGINFAQGWGTYSGFVDFWREHRAWQDTEYIFLSEQQLWLNLNKMEGWDKINLSIGTEVELSNNFVDKGFYAIPTLAAKWTFN